MSRDREKFGEQESWKKLKREIINSITTTDHAIASPGGGAMARSHVAALAWTALNTATPCAACKLLRRRCAEECPFSPYFSPHEPHKFAAVHRVFGASNVSKMLLEVPQSQRADAANSLVYEANLRLRDPVYGCMGAISTLQQQIQSLQAELTAVRTEIIRYKYREAAATANAATTVSSNTPITIQNSHNSSTVAALIPSAVPAVSVAVGQPPLTPSPQPNPAPPPTPPPLPSPSIVVSSSSSSNSSTTTSMYNNPRSSAAAYSSMTADNNVPYFD